MQPDQTMAVPPSSFQDEQEAAGSPMLRQIIAMYSRIVVGLIQAALSICSALVAYMPARWFGLQDGFWAAITAIAVTQGECHATAKLGQKQCIGALIGGGVGLGFVLQFGAALWVYVAAVVVSITVCAALNKSDSGQLAGVTATIVLLVPHSGSAESIVVSRLSEVALGVISGVAVVWLGRHIKARQGLRLLRGL
ncbi:FUSC family protein [Acetobacter conturbans]|uniref:FUSC family protein n=1 Tax=Acetobacter conturbans TaxID=1737472 RepID=A0ABX0K9V4_9PROT|nr:FUSC family protein [Acetobacter conturbans]NHN90174.1 FUSC family protein [Acetobacter conturbans]